jgi:hypothetical protein
MPPRLKRSPTPPFIEFSLVPLSPLGKDCVRPRPSPPILLSKPVCRSSPELGQIATATAFHPLHGKHHSACLSLQIIEPPSAFYFSSRCRSRLWPPATTARPSPQKTAAALIRSAASTLCRSSVRSLPPTSCPTCSPHPPHAHTASRAPLEPFSRRQSSHRRSDRVRGDCMARAHAAPHVVRPLRP